MQVQNRTGLDVWRSKHPLLACHSHCKCSVKTSRNLVIRSKSVILGPVWSQSHKQLSVMSDQWRVSLTVYGHVPECHVTFGKGRLIHIDEISTSTIELPKRRF